jgi:transposase
VAASNSSRGNPADGKHASSGSPPDAPANIIRLPGYAVRTLRETGHDYHIQIETLAPTAACPACQGTRCVGYGRSELLVHDLPMHGKRVGLYIDARRFKCRDCDKTFMETLPEVDGKRRMTERLAQWIGPRSLNYTFTSVAEEIGVTEGTIRNLAHDYIDALEQAHHFETPEWMGIDEIHLLRRPRAVITNLRKNTAIDLLPDRDKRSILRYLAAMKHKDRIHTVAMDMWRPYRDAVLEVLPDASVVVDKFHVLRMANQSMDELRRSLSRSKDADRLRRKAAGVKKDAYLFRKREKDLDDSERLILDGWLRSIPELGEAWRLKEGFYGVYDADNKKDAHQRYIVWAASVPPECQSAFQPILTAWKNWEPYILAYFDQQVTNAFTESLNSLIRVTNRMGRGYSFEVLRAKILFTRGTHKKTMQRPKFRRESLGTTAFYHMGMALPLESDEDQTEINYGVDLRLLAEALDTGGNDAIHKSPRDLG